MDINYSGSPDKVSFTELNESQHRVQCGFVLFSKLMKEQKIPKLARISSRDSQSGSAAAKRCQLTASHFFRWIGLDLTGHPTVGITLGRCRRSTRNKQVLGKARVANPILALSSTIPRRSRSRHSTYVCGCPKQVMGQAQVCRRCCEVLRLCCGILSNRFLKETSESMIWIPFLEYRLWSMDQLVQLTVLNGPTYLHLVESV